VPLGEFANSLVLGASHGVDYSTTDFGGLLGC
jgi:hypothetical protein